MNRFQTAATLAAFAAMSIVNPAFALGDHPPHQVIIDTHLTEVPATCGDAHASFATDLGHHFVVAAKANDDISLGGFSVQGIDGVPVNSFSFLTSNCDDNIFLFFSGKTDGGGTFTVGTTGCPNGSDGFTKRDIGHGLTQFSMNLDVFKKNIPFTPTVFTSLFAGFIGPDHGLVGDFQLNGHPAAPDLHNLIILINPVCVNGGETSAASDVNTIELHF